MLFIKSYFIEDPTHRMLVHVLNVELLTSLSSIGSEAAALHRRQSLHAWRTPTKLSWNMADNNYVQSDEWLVGMHSNELHSISRVALQY